MTFTHQRTLGAPFEFEGKGLHTGKLSRMTVKPAPDNTGIRFKRVDLGEDAVVDALADNISSTARNTTLTLGSVSVSTIEHLMSAFTGLGIDNALVELDCEEVPILDGSARPYAEAFSRVPLRLQEAQRKFLQLPREIEVRDEATGAWVKATPASTPSYDITVDFNSRVLGVQQAHWAPGLDYSAEIAPCRTFVFFHEIEHLFQHNLIKGGDVDNAIVIVEHPVTPKQVAGLSQLFRVPGLSITESGYLNNLQLHFPNECGRHKLLDLIGDLRLSGGFLSARITAFKPGHTLNARLSKAIEAALQGEKF